MTKTWDAESRLTRLDLPEGNSLIYSYDGTNPNRYAQGNLIQVVQSPGPRAGDQTLLTTTYTYEPIYNLRRTVTSPRGDDLAGGMATGPTSSRLSREEREAVEATIRGIFEGI